MLRRFTSYGPVTPRSNFFVPRTALVESCVELLVGQQEEPGGHYFTIWAPRQTGKTWLMRRAVEEIRARYGERFIVGTLSMQGSGVSREAPPGDFLAEVPALFRRGMGLTLAAPSSWSAWGELFAKGAGIFDRPLILLIDEFDKLPPAVIDELVGQFRSLYLERKGSLLHGLALVGVRALLGVESGSRAPFNVQRWLHVPNLTRDEVADLFRQYQGESGQVVEPAVVDALFEVTRGQPGLVGWFGELLTERYNPRPEPISVKTWRRVYAAACQVEPNNTMLNLLKKAKGPYLPQLLEVFSRTDVPFSFGQDWCNYLYLNGILTDQETVGANGEPFHVCRFSSPFVQQRLFNDLSKEFVERVRDLPLDPMDTLADVFTEAGLDVPALLRRYVAFLGRLHKKGADPWPMTLNDQPRRADLRHTEAVGHFHLYNWLCAAVGTRCLISPEFPTGNGTVDLVLRWQGHLGVIEVKSFVDQHRLALGQAQAAAYAKKLGLGAATLAVFVPLLDEAVLSKLSGQRDIDGITVTTVALPWEP